MIGNGLVFIRLCQAPPAKLRVPQPLAEKVLTFNHLAAVDYPRRDRSDARTQSKRRTSEGAELSLEHHRPRLCGPPRRFVCIAQFRLRQR
jgi:hypothetical protein